MAKYLIAFFSWIKVFILLLNQGGSLSLHTAQWQPNGLKCACASILVESYSWNWEEKQAKIDQHLTLLSVLWYQWIWSICFSFFMHEVSRRVTQKSSIFLGLESSPFYSQTGHKTTCIYFRNQFLRLLIFAWKKQRRIFGSTKSKCFLFAGYTGLKT